LIVPNNFAEGAAMELDDLGERQDESEASLVWDEYKYRHDLIWRHLIRSTTAVVVLLAVQYFDYLPNDPFLISAAFFLAIGYTAFTYWVLQSELRLYEQVKQLHRKRQRALYGLHEDDKSTRPWGFSNRVRLYVIVLFVLSVAAAVRYYWVQ
jgi:hypothetical protein